jgi:hypothetical protein
MTKQTARYLNMARLALRRAERFSHIHILYAQSLAECRLYITLARAASEA